MNFSKILVFTFLLIIFTLAGCGGGSSENKAPNANTPAANTNTNTAPPANNALETTKTPEVKTVNQAETITPVYKAYCAAMEKKDEAAVRKIYSKDTLKSFEADMKEEGVKSLIEYLSTDKVTTKLCEVRNEQIQGDTAIAEVRAEGYPNGIRVKFVKEDGAWKMTNQSPDFPKK